MFEWLIFNPSNGGFDKLYVKVYQMWFFISSDTKEHRLTSIHKISIVHVKLFVYEIRILYFSFLFFSQFYQYPFVTDVQ